MVLLDTLTFAELAVLLDQAHLAAQAACAAGEAARHEAEAWRATVLQALVRRGGSRVSRQEVP
jgi:hypothetical protein